MRVCSGQLSGVLNSLKLALVFVFFLFFFFGVLFFLFLLGVWRVKVPKISWYPIKIVYLLRLHSTRLKYRPRV